MSRDLDQMFGALRYDADAIPLGGASTARRHGERRRRTRLIAATAAVACVVGAGLTAGGWLARHDAAPRPAGPPRPLTDVIPLEGNAESFTPSAISGDRVLVAWRTQQQQLAVRLADLETGRPLGPTRTLGPTLNYPHVAGLPWAFVATGDGTGGRAYVLDPESGDVRWSLPFDDQTGDLLYYPAALVVMTGDGTTRGLDWVTGAPLWEAPAPADRPVRSLGISTPADPLPRDMSIDADPFDYARPLTDDRLVQITAGGKLVVRDARTGEHLGTHPGAAPLKEADYVADDGRVYMWSRAAPFRLTVTDVDGDAEPRPLYEGADGRYGAHVVPCGTGRVCFVESDDAAAEVVAVEVRDGRVAWRMPVSWRAPTLQPSGDRLLVSAEDGSSALFDETGRQLLGSEEQRTPLVWLSTGSLLTMGREQLVEVSAADGTSRVLATSPEGRWLCSSWTERRLVCQIKAASVPSASPASLPPGDGGFQIWTIGK